MEMSKDPDSAGSIEVVDFSERWADDFASLNYEWIEKFFTIEKHDREILDHPQTAVIDPGGKILMAVDNGKAVGTVALIPAGDLVLELIKMAVRPDHQGRGIGDLLIEASIASAREIGAIIVFLESHRSLGPALNLYRKHGFVETPIDPNSLYARADIRMQLALLPQDM